MLLSTSAEKVGWNLLINLITVDLQLNSKLFFSEEHKMNVLEGNPVLFFFQKPWRNLVEGLLNYSWQLISPALWTVQQILNAEKKNRLFKYREKDCKTKQRFCNTDEAASSSYQNAETFHYKQLVLPAHWPHPNPNLTHPIPNLSVTSPPSVQQLRAA